MKGKVKWINDRLGYGFIESYHVEEDIFVHFSEIKKEGFKTLYEGDLVEFDYDKDLNKAVNVRVIRKAKYYKYDNESNNVECI